MGLKIFQLHINKSNSPKSMWCSWKGSNNKQSTVFRRISFEIFGSSNCNQFLRWIKLYYPPMEEWIWIERSNNFRRWYSENVIAKTINNNIKYLVPSETKFIGTLESIEIVCFKKMTFLRKLKLQLYVVSYIMFIHLATCTFLNEKL